MTLKNNKIKLATNNTCTGCMACVDSCTKNALTASIGKDGFFHIILNKTVCNQCGSCTKTCPVITYNKPAQANNNPRPFAAWSKSEEVRFLSASGGAFAEFALQILSEGGIAIGATLKDNKVYHILIDKKEDLVLLQNSKYIQSNATGIYILAKKYLKEGKKVLFSGTPCQVAGLYGFLGAITYSELLVTAEVICHGVPSEMIINGHLKINHAEKILHFRDKDQGHAKSYRTSLQKLNRTFSPIKTKGRDAFYSSFFSDSVLRNSCYNCKFSTLPRVADLSLGDYWGCEEWSNEKEKGISLVLVNNKNGTDLLIKTKNLINVETEWEKCLPKNSRIYTGYNLKQYLPSRLLFNWFCHKPESKHVRQLINLLPSKIISWMLPFKLVNKIISFLQIQTMRRKLKNQINAFRNEE